MTDLRWQMVTCARCGDTYQCTPDRDYWALQPGTAAEPGGGYCWDCLLILRDMPPQPEPHIGDDRFRT